MERARLDDGRDAAERSEAGGPDPQACVRAFHVRFGVAVPQAPALPPPATAAMRMRLIHEETRELEDALADADLVGVADAIADLLYVTLGTAVTCGIDIRPIFAEVHRSNMTKDPRAGAGPDGKVVKGARFEPPVLAPLLRAQGWGTEGDAAGAGRGKPAGPGAGEAAGPRDPVGPGIAEAEGCGGAADAGTAEAAGPGEPAAPGIAEAEGCGEAGALLAGEAAGRGQAAGFHAGEAAGVREAAGADVGEAAGRDAATGSAVGDPAG